MARRPKFRKGDKVRYLSGDNFSYTTGKIYEIEHVFPYLHEYNITTDYGDSLTWSLGAAHEFFEKVEEEKDNGEV